MNRFFTRESSLLRSGLFSAMVLSALIAAAVIFNPVTTHADTYVNYDIVNATFASGATLTGTFQIDVTAGDIPYSSNGVTYITAANLTVTEPDSTTINFGCPEAASNACLIYDSVAGYTEYGFLASTSPSQFLWLNWPINSPTDSFSFLLGGPNVGSYCYGCTAAGQIDYLTAGSAIDPPNDGPTNTPEPATGLLLIPALGLLAFVGFRRTATSA